MIYCSIGVDRALGYGNFDDLACLQCICCTTMRIFRLATDFNCKLCKSRSDRSGNATLIDSGSGGLIHGVCSPLCVRNSAMVWWR